MEEIVMQERSGFISEDELKTTYGGVGVMFLDGTNDTTSSDRVASGGGNYTWSIRWNEDGFSGQNWVVSISSDLDIEDYMAVYGPTYDSTSYEGKSAFIDANAAFMANLVASGNQLLVLLQCVSFVETAS